MARRYTELQHTETTVYKIMEQKEQFVIDF